MESLVRSFAHDLTRPRRYNYTHDSLEELLTTHPDIRSSNPKIPNPRNHHLDLLHLRHSTSDTCILYAHGLGSNKLEALPLAKYFLKHGCDICSFDFSASGKSEGDLTTYGLYQKDDVLTVLRYLEHNTRYDHLVLWGRSMGAVASVLALEEPSKVDCLVLDSPFSSFERVAVETAAKKSLIPQFMLEMVIEPLKIYFQQHMHVNPFKIDLQKALKKIDTRILLIYSQNDTIINSSHAKQIIKHCKRNPIELLINQDHNMQRSKSTLAKTLAFIRDSARQAERKAVLSKSKNRGISVTSKEGKDRLSIRSGSQVKISRASSIKQSPWEHGKASIWDHSKASAWDHSKVSAWGLNSKVSAWDHNLVGRQTERNMRTVASFHDSIQYSKRSETETSPSKKKGVISSIFFQSRNNLTKLHANKENIKPCLNMLRKNRFR